MIGIDLVRLLCMLQEYSLSLSRLVQSVRENPSLTDIDRSTG